MAQEGNNIKKRGFGSMSKEERVAAARKGGKAKHKNRNS